jgi:glycosyltransferase involved in cell wall biosynthesis
LLARQLNKPLMVSLRQTDFYVLKYRPDLIPLMKKILRFSGFIFYIMPYMVSELEKRFGARFVKTELESKLVFLPNIIERECKPPKISSPRKYFFTALRMTRKSVKRKNIKGLFKALKTMGGMDYELHIAGAGPYLEVLQRWSERYRIAHKLVFLGAIPNSEMDRYYAEATAFVMPSYSETFGMVYAEALMNGTPILYSKDTGFDGLFENVGVAVDPHSSHSIGSGLRELIHKNGIYREAICNLAKTASFHIFSPRFAQNAYSQVLNKFD